MLSVDHRMYDSNFWQGTDCAGPEFLVRMEICSLLPALCTVGALLTVAIIRQPMYNRDVIGYVAAACSWLEDDPQTVYERTCTDVERNTADEVNAVLIGQLPMAAAGLHRRLAVDPPRFGKGSRHRRGFSVRVHLTTEAPA